MITQKVYTMDDFVKFTERLSEQKFEFVRGQIIPLYANEPVKNSLIDYVLSNEFDEKELTTRFPMATIAHATIVSNLHGHLFAFARPNALKVYSQGIDVLIPLTGSPRIPDIVVASKAEERSNERYQILNPLLLVEVLSKSTQSKDKLEKLEEYQSLPSLQEYVMVAQDQPRLTVYRKLTANKWQQEYITGLSQTVELQSINFKILLKEIYEDVDFAGE